MKDKLNDSLANYGWQLEKLADKISPHFEAETIHRFRTITKKMRALLRWLGNGKDDLPASFIKIYHATGDLRDAQVLVEGLATEKDKLPAFTLWLDDYIESRKQRWDKLYHKKIIHELQDKLAELPANKLYTRALSLFFKKRLKKMHEISRSSSPPDDVLHEVRKMSKDMQYVNEWCEKNLPKEERIKYFSQKQLEKLGEQAGNYNDRRTGLQLLVAYLNKEKNKKASVMAETWREQQVHERNLEKTKFLSSLKRFCYVTESDKFYLV